jgi:hypothetical protein
MAKSIPSGLKIEYDNSSGSLIDISQYVLELSDVTIEQIEEEVHSFGDSWEEHLPVGIGKTGNVTLTGLYDDTASTGPDALFAGRIPETPATSTRTLKITWLAGKTTSVETYLVSYTRTADRSALTRWSAELVCTGAVTEA